MALRSTLTQWYPPAPDFTEKNIPSQAGKVFMVTGGNAGIGFELCKILYGAGATIYIASRSQERAEKAIDVIKSGRNATPGRLIFLPLDLSDLTKVQTAAKKFLALETRLDLLVHNAGMSPYDLGPFAKTAQGIESMVGMHCVAPLLLTHHLLPLLRASAATSSPGDVRVLWTSSIAAEFNTPTNGFDFSTLGTGTGDGQHNYGVSKLGNWALAQEGARRHRSEGIMHLALNPGNVRAGTYKSLPKVTFFLLNTLVLKDTRFGAYTELFAGLSPEVAKKDWNGGYIIPFGRMRPDADSHRKDIIKALMPVEEGGLGYSTKFWEWCEEQGKAFI